MMTVLGAYWSTLGLLAVVAFFVTGYTFINLEGYKRVLWARVIIPFDALIILATIFGFWLPVMGVR